MITRTNQQLEYDRIESFIRDSDLPRKRQKLDGLRAASLKRISMALLDDMILVDGVAIDPSELENGYWL